MAICPFATVKLLPPGSPSYDTQRIAATQIIAHSIGDPGATAQNLYDFWSGAGSDGNSSHFFVTKAGGVWQFVDTAYECYASLNANRRSDGTGAIAFESEDVGDPDTEPWTPAAVAAITRLCLWLIQVHPGIAKRECRTPVDPGLGYHSMWGYNTPANPTRNPWTRAYGKTCPGVARIPQWQHTIVPAVLAGHSPGGTMALDPDVKAAFDGVNNNIGTAVHGDGGHPDSIKNVRQSVTDLTAKVDSLTAAVHGLATGGGVVDPAVLADALASALAARLAS